MSKVMSVQQTSLAETLSDMPRDFAHLGPWITANWPALLIWIAWIAAAVISAALLYFFIVRARDRLLRHLRQGERGRASWRELIASVLESTWRIFFVILAAALAASLLGILSQTMREVLFAVLIVQGGVWIASFSTQAFRWYAEGRRGDRSVLANAISLINILINVAVWSVVVLALLSNLGIDITALVAGLGIGGIAIGLAAQGIFSDLFASLSIVFDRPFIRGDFVVFGDSMGTVEYVGIKSTRIRSLSGEQIVISNSNLLQATIRNYQRLHERRVVFAIGVTYQTPPEEVRRIPILLREAIESAPKTRFDRSHFKEYGDSALTYESVYFVLDSDFNVYMDVQQTINFEIMRLFAKHGIEFAYPTRTILLTTQETKRPGTTNAKASPLAAPMRQPSS